MLRPYAPSQATLTQWVDRILDWRDPDSERRPQGAEDIDYRRAGAGYGPRNGPFLDVNELSRVLGIPASVPEGLARYLTVYSGEGKINPLLASREALLLLPGADPVDIDRTLQSRNWRATQATSHLARSADGLRRASVPPFASRWSCAERIGRPQSARRWPSSLSAEMLQRPFGY